MPLSKIQLSSSTGRRRLNPNGAMLVSQRATTKATLTNGYNCLDRVYTYKNHDGVVEESQSTDVPNSDFYNSLKHRVTTADTSIAATQYHSITTRLEGGNVTQLGFGTSGAKKVTVSFWVKSSVAGAYGAAIRNNNSTRFNQATVTINSADTWEKKSITYTGDTGGTWNKNTSEGLQFQLSQAMGTSYQGTSADTWVTDVDVAPANQVNWLATVGNTFYITGLQIEEGDTATEFEHLSFAEELLLCQRYFQVVGNSAYFAGNGVGSASIAVGIPLATPMRAEPSVPDTGYKFHRSGNTNSGTNSVTAVTYATIGSSNLQLRVNFGSSISDEVAYVLNATTADLHLESEL